MARILVADDEPGVRLVLAGLLTRAGHDVDAVGNGGDALQRLAARTYDLLLVDLLMDDIDGLSVIERARDCSPATATIVLTGHPSADSAIRALRDEVDDFLVKPARVDEIRETVARVLDRRQVRQEREVFLQRLARDVQHLVNSSSVDPSPSPQPGLESLRLGPLELDLEAHHATWYGRALKLTPTEFRLLTVLAKNASRVLPCQRLVEELRGYRCTPREARDLVKPHILHLRSKLEPESNRPRFLLTVRGVGYSLRLDATNAVE